MYWTQERLKFGFIKMYTVYEDMSDKPALPQIIWHGWDDTVRLGTWPSSTDPLNRTACNIRRPENGAEGLCRTWHSDDDRVSRCDSKMTEGRRSTEEEKGENKEKKNMKDENTEHTTRKGLKLFLCHTQIWFFLEEYVSTKLTSSQWSWKG